MLGESISRASSKKKKRLDKYIVRKLKKASGSSCSRSLRASPSLPSPSSLPLPPSHSLIWCVVTTGKAKRSYP